MGQQGLYRFPPRFDSHIERVTVRTTPVLDAFMAERLTLSVAQSWGFSEEEGIAYFADGGFTDELVAAAGVSGLQLALTVSPGSSKEYSKPEFGRDLYLLEQSGERVTRKGARVSFPRSTSTKSSAGMITVVGEDGRRVDYASIGFEV